MKGRYGMTTSNLQMPDGILLIDKPSGMTSHDVVGKVRRLYNTRRVGHTGTLDPMATGVLTVLIGRAAKSETTLSLVLAGIVVSSLFNGACRFC